MIDNAADEFIRYVTPVKHFMRTCRAPFTLRDVTFGEGEFNFVKVRAEHGTRRAFELRDDHFEVPEP